MTGHEVDPIVLKYQKPGVQCFHGGQSWQTCPNFKCDFSVTTNISGPPKQAQAAAIKEFENIEHYPEQDSWRVRCHLAEVFKLPPTQILLGNGASEFIDIVPRTFEKGKTWRTGPWPAQFMEYERASKNAGLIKVPASDENADYTIMINPNSPTADNLTLDELREMINKSKSTFIIDESFVMCKGPNWVDESAMRLIDEFGDRVIVIMSWTKVFACPLLRLGTVASSRANIEKIEQLQCPWSVNGFAQAFMITTLDQPNYFDEMWENTKEWKKMMVDGFTDLRFIPNPNSPLYIPYVYVDMLSPEINKFAEKVAFDAGYPVRNCASFDQPQFTRFGVRTPYHIRGLLDAYKKSEEWMNMIAEHYSKQGQVEK